MRKLKLDVEALTVESFTPDAAAREHAGTVHAQQQDTRGRTVCNFSCQVGCTEQISCFNPCV